MNEDNRQQIEVKKVQQFNEKLDKGNLLQVALELKYHIRRGENYEGAGENFRKIGK
jgi:hypothetical protein